MTPPFQTSGPSGVPLNDPFVFHTSRDSRDELVIVDREGGDLRLLARFASRSDWSRDGRIAFDSRAAGSKGIFVVYPDGSGRRYVGPGNDPSWSPDGRFIAVSHDNGIYVLDVNGSAAPRLVASPPSALDGVDQPAWSPDGQVIAFSVSRCGESLLFDFGCPYGGVYAVRADGSDLPVLIVGGPAHAPAWSTDGRSLAYASDLQVLVMDYPGGSPRLAGSGSLPAWTSDGRLVYQSTDNTPGWRLMIHDGSASRRLVPDVPSTLSWYGDEHISPRR